MQIAVEGARVSTELRTVWITVTAADPIETVALDRLSGPHRRGVQVLAASDLAAWQQAYADGDVVSASRLATGGLVLWDRSWWLTPISGGYAIEMPYPDNTITREAMERLMAPALGLDELELGLHLLDLERQRRGLSFPAAAQQDAADGSAVDSDPTDESVHSPAPAQLECAR